MRTAEFARRSAERAREAAVMAAGAAEMRERLLGDSPAAVAELRARTAVMHRRAEACQRAADRLLTRYAQRLEEWATRADAGALLRPLLMREVARFAGWGGVVLTLRSRSGGEVLVAASDVRARRVYELQVTLDEGPTREVAQGREAVAYGAQLERRWPRFAQEAGALGVQAAAAMPVHLGATHMGGSLSAIGPPPERSFDLQGLRTVAQVLDTAILHAPGLVRGRDTELPGLEMFEQEDFQPGLHQAAGVLHERHGWEVNGVVALIRMHAYAENRSVAEVAEDVLLGRLWTA